MIKLLCVEKIIMLFLHPVGILGAGGKAHCFLEVNAAVAMAKIGAMLPAVAKKKRKFIDTDGNV